MKALSRLRRGASDALLSSSPRTPGASTGSLEGAQGRSQDPARPGDSAGASPSGSPPSGGKPARSRPPRRLQLLLLALLPAVVATATLASLARRHRAHSEVASALLAANARAHRWGSGHGNRLLWEAAAGGAPGRQAAGSRADGRSCADALQVPQVAMLFLVKGRLRHEALWRAWFERAAGLLPTRAVASALCTGGDNLPSMLAACAAAAAGPAVQDPAAAAAAAVAAAAAAGGQRNASAAAAATAAGAAAAAAAAQQTQRRDLSGSAEWVHWLTDHWGAPEKERGAAPPPSVLDQQHLFDVYAHPHPNFTGYPPGALLHGRELPDSERVATEWGTHTLVEAAEALLTAALRNPRNQKFLMLSESDLPLYSPHTTYVQLMREHRSRLNACNTTQGWDLDFYRWVDRMSDGGYLHKHEWRKSSQWFVLTRRHVEIILADWRLERIFRRHCKTMFEEDRGSERVCYPDEHYFPTLLAARRLDNETDCEGRLTDVDWGRVHSTSPHPWEYKAGEVRDRLFEGLRRTWREGCGNAVAALAAAPAAFMPQAQLFEAAVQAAAAAGDGSSTAEAERAGRGICQELLLRQQQAPAYPPLGPQCPLLARKFQEHTVKPALMALAPCDSSALILNDGTCPGETERQRYLRQLWWRAAPWVLLCSCVLAVALTAHAHMPLQVLARSLLRAGQRRRSGRVGGSPSVSTPLLDV